MQNGVENADRLRALLPQEVIAAAVYVGTEMAGPGHVRYHGRGELVSERWKSSEEVVRALIVAGVPTEISDNVRGALWAKLITNCAYNALSAITQLPYGRLVKGEGVTVVMRDLVDECLAVAKADGVTIPGDVDVAVRKIAETAAGQYASTAQDLEADFGFRPRDADRPYDPTTRGGLLSTEYVLDASPNPALFAVCVLLRLR